MTAVIDTDDLERLIRAADLADIEAARTAREKREKTAAGEESIPWDEVKKDLGL